jgi:hypothetical protein
MRRNLFWLNRFCRQMFAAESAERLAIRRILHAIRNGHCWCDRPPELGPGGPHTTSLAIGDAEDRLLSIILTGANAANNVNVRRGLKTPPPSPRSSSFFPPR